MTDESARKVIENNLFMTLASSHGDMPWATPVFYAYDKEYNFYWYSRKDASHSKNIAGNPHVSAVIFNSDPNNEDIKAVYITGFAGTVEEDAPLREAILVYANRAFKDDKSKLIDVQASPQDFLRESPLRMYKLNVEKMWKLANSVIWNNKWLDYREEVQL